VAAIVKVCYVDLVVVHVVVGPIGSKLAERFGCRVVTMTGGLLLCLGLVFCSLATKLFHVYLALGLVAGNLYIQNKCLHVAFLQYLHARSCNYV